MSAVASLPLPDRSRDSAWRGPLLAAGGAPVAWQVSDAPVDYPDAVAAMEARVAAISAGEAPELVWLVEHPPLYTAGTSAKPSDLLEPGRFRKGERVQAVSVARGVGGGVALSRVIAVTPNP